MKKLLLLTLFPLAVYSCKKGDGAAAGYTLTGTKDFALNTGSTDSMSVTLTDASNLQKNVTLSIEGLPAKVTATIDPAQGIPPFTSKIKFTTAMDAADGSYDLKLVAQSVNGASKQVPFKLTVALDCAQHLAAAYNGTDSSSGTHNTVYVYKSAGNQIQFNGFIGGPNSNIYADVNCGTNRLTVPSQQVNASGSNLTISGNGQFTADYRHIVVRYNVLYPGGSMNATMLLDKF